MTTRRAIIIGGGVSGLATALAIRTHFDEVVILERDEYPEDLSERRYTPQGHHVHVLLARGLSEFVALAPELPAWLDEAGLPEGDLTRDIWLAQAGKWLPRRRSGIAFRPCTRPVLEHYLRRTIAQYTHIEIRSGVQVDSLIGSERIEGVNFSRPGDTSEPSTLHAEWVVDACGRNSKAARWLEASGHGRVEESVVDAKVSYASCFFEPKPDAQFPCGLLGITGALGTDPRMGTVMPGGGGRWLAAVINYVGGAPPKTIEEFLEQSAALSAPDIHQLLLQATPCSQLSVFTNNANRIRHFARLETSPERYVVLGDAVCTLNPRFGQGMTVAALGATLLGEQLAEHRAKHENLDGLAGRFQRGLERKLDAPWQMATSEDKTWLALQRGNLSFAERMNVAASRRLFQTMSEDYETYVRVNRVAHMIAPMRTLAAPSMIAKLLFPRMRSLGEA